MTKQTLSVIQRLAQDTSALKANWCLPPEAAQLLYLLTRIQKAQKALEIGTSIGFSTLNLALALWENASQQAHLMTVDASEERLAVAQRHFQEAGLASVIEPRLGQALDVLKALHPQDIAELDLVFIDARKSEYLAYVQHLEAHLKPGCLLVADNTQSHRDEMGDFVTYILKDTTQWDSADIDTPNGLIVARKRG